MPVILEFRDNPGLSVAGPHMFDSAPLHAGPTHGESAHAGVARVAALVAILGALLFLGVAGGLQLVRDDLAWAQATLSQYLLGPYGLLLRTMYCLLAVAIVALALGLYAQLAPRARSAAPVLLLCTGAMALAGVAVGDSWLPLPAGRPLVGRLLRAAVGACIVAAGRAGMGAETAGRADRVGHAAGRRLAPSGRLSCGRWDGALSFDDTPENDFMIQRFDVGPRLSEMAIHNGVIYLAGQVAEDATQGIAGQTQQVLAEIDALLARAGSDKAKILRAEIFLKDLQDFEAMNRVWDAWVPAGHAPPRATVQAHLARPGWLIEIVVTAAV